MQHLILASGSAARQSLLRNAGVDFEIVLPEVDEDVIRAAVAADTGAIDPADLAELLARAKADNVSQRRTEALVLAGDQVLSCDRTIYSKPPDMDAARRQLLDLRGKTHELHTAVVLARAGEVLWERVTTADVTFRDFSPQFVGRYLAMAGDKALGSVGAYQIEGPGIQLIQSFRGDYFTVLGLPMIEVLQVLRAEGVLDQ